MIENDNSAKDWLNNADMLTEALPYIHFAQILHFLNKVV